jgi:hypothetical protein
LVSPAPNVCAIATMVFRQRLQAGDHDLRIHICQNGAQGIAVYGLSARTARPFPVRQGACGDEVGCLALRDEDSDPPAYRHDRIDAVT